MTQHSFPGFEPANTTPVPDVLFDELLAELNESELKVLLYIIRRTAGFKKPTDAISLTQFQKGIKKRATGEILDRGCGVKDRTTIVKALTSLEKRGCIESTKTNDAAGDKATSTYRIKFRSGVVGKTHYPQEIGSGQNPLPQWAEPTTVVGKTDYGVVGKSYPQETVIQDTDSQETVIQEDTLRVGAANADTTRTTASHSQEKALSPPSSGCPIDDTTVVTQPVQQATTEHNSTTTPSYSRTTHAEQRETIRSESTRQNEQQRASPVTSKQPHRSQVKPARSEQPRESPPSRSRSKQASQPVVLSQEEQAFYDLYCSMPWIAIKPKITEKLKEQCARFAPHLKTQERLIKLRNWMNADRWYKGKGFALGMIEHALNDWLMTQIEEVPAKPPIVAPVSVLTAEEAARLAERAVEQAREVGREIEAAVQSENGISAVVIDWKTRHFNKPAIVKSVARWEQAFNDMRKVWNYKPVQREVLI